MHNGELLKANKADCEVIQNQKNVKICYESVNYHILGSD